MSVTLAEAHGAPLRDPARVSGVGALELGAERPADTRSSSGTRACSPRGGVRRPRCLGRDAGLTRIQADSRQLAVPGRKPSEVPRAASGSWTGSGSRGSRVLRVMRAHKLLSPHRGRHGAARVHRIDAANVPRG